MDYNFSNLISKQSELEENATVVNLDDPDEEAIEAIARLMEFELEQAQKKLQ